MSWWAWKLRALRQRAASLAARYRLDRMLRLLLVFALIWFGGAAALFHFERGAGPRFGSYRESVWGILVHLLSGFEDYVPATAGGRATSVVVMLCGVTLVGWFTAQVAAILVELARRGEYLPRVPEQFAFSGHIVLCGWDRRGPELVRLIEGAFGGRPPAIVILASQAGSIPRREVPSRQVWAAEGDPTRDDDLRRVSLSGARAAVILSDPAWPDEFVVLAGLAIESLCPRVHTIAAGAEQDAALLSRAGVDEVVEVRQMGRLLLAQAALTPGISACYDELLTATPDSNELYLVPAPAAWHGRRYDELALWLAGRERPDPLILAGLAPAGESPQINPRRGAREHRLRPGDRLLVVARGEPRVEEW